MVRAAGEPGRRLADLRLTRALDIRGQLGVDFGRLQKMTANLKNTAVHIKKRGAAAHRLRASDAPNQRFVCRRCHRTLDEGQFAPLPSENRRFTYLHPFCFRCRGQQKSKLASHPLVTPKLHAFVRKLMSATKAGAASRGLVVGLDADDVLQLYVDQGGRCAMTGLPMTCEAGRQARVKAAAVRGARDQAWTALSLDRIDSGGNYTVDNVHLVCRAVNIMKNDMSADEFGEWCKRVVLHALSRQNDAQGGADTAADLFAED